MEVLGPPAGFSLASSNKAQTKIVIMTSLHKIIKENLYERDTPRNPTPTSHTFLLSLVHADGMGMGCQRGRSLHFQHRAV